jgi:aminoglycoside phosphotransferase (APT) family kinase protein
MPLILAPDDVVETAGDIAAGSREPLLILETLRWFLHSSGLDGPEDLGVEPIGEGHSNVTFVLSTGVVLRRPPRGPLPPSAHDVVREARLLRALEHTGVRVPRVLAICEDAGVIGAPFYVMERSPGVVVDSALPAALDTEAQRGRVADELIDALVELHAVDWAAAGLGDFGRPSGYLERQLRRFGGLWEHNHTRELPAVEEVGRWLAANVPDSPSATIVHGDYRLGNVLFEQTAPAHLTAILDWEMATIGDPLADVGYTLMFWAQAGDDLGPLSGHAVTMMPGFPTRAGVIERYEARSGRSMQALDWYVTLAMWKATVFMEGNYKRAVTGATDDPYLKTFGDAVVALAERALAVTRDGFA